MNEILMQDGKRYLELKARKDELEDELKAVKEEITGISERMVDQMNSIELDKFSAYGSTFSVRRSIATNVNAADKDDLFYRLRTEGYGDLIQETVNPRTLTAFVKEQMAQTTDGLVPGWLGEVVDVYYKSDISVRKAAKA